MENNGFCNDKYGNESSDDDLVDVSASAQDILEDLPYDEQYYGQGMPAAPDLCCTSSRTFIEGPCGLCYSLNINGEKYSLLNLW